MKYYVYIIIADKKNNLVSYVGYTKNLNERIKKHNTSKGAKFTKGKYWKLAYFKVYNSKSKAMSEEYKLKKNIKFRNKVKYDFKKNENFNTFTL